VYLRARLWKFLGGLKKTDITSEKLRPGQESKAILKNGLFLTVYNMLFSHITSLSASFHET